MRAVKTRKGQCIITPVKSIVTICTKLLRNNQLPSRPLAVGGMIKLKLLKLGSLKVISVPLFLIPSCLCLGFLGLKHIRRCLANVHKF